MLEIFNGPSYGAVETGKIYYHDYRGRILVYHDYVLCLNAFSIMHVSFQNGQYHVV